MKHSLTVRIPAPNVRMARDVDQILLCQRQSAKQRDRGLVIAIGLSLAASLAAFWAWLWMTSR